ncbi:MAG: hypothetical protein N2484_00770 [Clostridia bacterium]|nr:hypothetical protein [Clostridia bacterium]
MSEAYGFFSAEGKEFTITTPKIPRHWYNYMWNDSYISFCSQVGFGEGFAQDSAGRRIHLISNRNLYVLDVENRNFWTANALPVRKHYRGYQCVHGLGYSEIKLEYQSIQTSFRVFVPEAEKCEIWTVRVKNNRSTACKLKVIPYYKTEIDGPYKPQGYNTGTGFFDESLKSVIGRSFTAFDAGRDAEFFGFLTGDKHITGYDSRKNAFIGTYGEELAPDAVNDGGCTNSECISEKLCFALETTFTLKSGEECEINFIAGIAFHKADIERIKHKFFTADCLQLAFKETKQKFSTQIEGVSIHTPDEKLNFLFNNWLKHQTNMGSRWARVRHNGFRDMTSDCECFSVVNQDLAWERLKRVLKYQYSNGYAPRTFIDGSIRDNHYADNTVWLTFAVSSLLNERGKLSMLEEIVEFNDGSSASVYEHLKRSVDFLWNFRGLHGLIRIWGGDWNDCMNKAGLNGKGVSVWLSIAWYRACKQFAEIARLKEEVQDADQAEIRAAEMREIIDAFGWDGEYYLAAYTDDGKKLGSKECEEGKIFILPQLWAVLSGVSQEGKDQLAMNAVDKYLDRELGTLISWPAYTQNLNDVGIMTQKPTGTQENGGVYLHASAWKLAADCLLKRNEKVQEGLEKILPFNSKWKAKSAEPYILCNSYFPEEAGYRYGTPGQSWRTASGAWLTKAIVYYVYGLQPELEGLRLNPCLPPDWKICSISKKFRNALYHITYEQSKEGVCNNIVDIEINNIAYCSSLLPYHENTTYDVKVILG